MKAEHHSAHPPCSHWSLSFGLAGKIPWRTFFVAGRRNRVGLIGRRPCHSSVRGSSSERAYRGEAGMRARVCRSFASLNRWIIMAPKFIPEKRGSGTGKKGEEALRSLKCVTILSHFSPPAGALFPSLRHATHTHTLSLSHTQLSFASYLAYFMLRRWLFPPTFSLGSTSSFVLLFSHTFIKASLTSLPLFSSLVSSPIVNFFSHLLHELKGCSDSWVSFTHWGS